MSRRKRRAARSPFAKRRSSPKAQAKVANKIVDRALKDMKKSGAQPAPDPEAQYRALMGEPNDAE